MKKIIAALILFSTILMSSIAQTKETEFSGHFVNKEYSIYLKINFNESGIIVPGHELFGSLPGYLGKFNNSFYWLITSSKVDGKKATIELINDYGSENLKAVLHLKNDTTVVYKFKEGSPLKVPNNRKWQKLPQTITFIKQK